MESATAVERHGAGFDEKKLRLVASIWRIPTAHGVTSCFRFMMDSTIAVERPRAWLDEE
jgi:hypothetical protein